MAKGKSPAFQFYPDAWLSSSSVVLMTPAEEGAFIRLLCHAWQSEDCGLPDDDDALAELSRLRSQWKKSSPRIRAKFAAVDGRLFNNRLLEEKQKQLVWREKSVEGGRRSGVKRRVVEPPFVFGSHLVGTKDEPPLLNGCDLVPTKCEPKGNSSSSSSFIDAEPLRSADAEQEKTLFELEVTTKDYDARWFNASFERWWASYWNKTAKTKARPAYEKRVKALVRKGRTHEQAEEFLIAAAADDKTRHECTDAWEWRVNLNPPTWLNQERWNDQAPQVARKVDKRDMPAPPRGLCPCGQPWAINGRCWECHEKENK